MMTILKKLKIYDLTINFAIACVSVSIVCILFEISLRMFSPQIFEVHPPYMYQADPEVGYVLRPDFSSSIKRSEFDVQFTTNIMGTRGLNPELLDQEDTYSILVLGDSMAWGFGVADNETFSVRLKQSIKEDSNQHVEVINGAVPGYGTVDQLNYLRANIDKFQPDLVVVQFFSVNDFIENQSPANEWATIDEMGMLGALDGFDVQLDENLPRIESWKQFAKQNSHLAKLCSDSLGYLIIRSGENFAPSMAALWGEDFSENEAALTIDLLNQVAELANKHNATVMFLYSTGQAQVVQDRYTPAESRQVVAMAAQKSNVAWVDLSEQMQAKDEKLGFYYPQDGHWTSAGHRAVAEIVQPYILQLLANE